MEVESVARVRSVGGCLTSINIYFGIPMMRQE